MPYVAFSKQEALLSLSRMEGLMFDFPRGLYTDVRIEEISQTGISYLMGKMHQSLEREYRAAFVRVFDGERWLYSSVSDPAAVQGEIDALAGLASGVPGPGIESSPVVRVLEANTGTFESFGPVSVSHVDFARKNESLRRSFAPLIGRESVRIWRAGYVDSHRRKHFLSSKGADLRFDTQHLGLYAYFEMADEEKRFRETAFTSADRFDELSDLDEDLTQLLDRSESFLENARPVEPGDYTVVLSPFAAGIFAHESFGHKSEADFMIGDEKMLEEWPIGSSVASGILTIIDDGSEPGSGYTPFDDEGTGSRRTHLVSEGILSGRLHSASTAAAMGEEPTGNGRSVGFEYEPIPRMTTTWIEPGDLDRQTLFGEIDKGIFVDTVLHGSGLSTFTIAPSICYMIRDGEVAEPVNVSVITGNVMETLGRIDGLSGTREIAGIPVGGCGKHEQAPLSVGFGGPFVRVRGMSVR